MGGKRKAPLPEKIDVEPKDRSGLFAVHFPSGFDPEKSKSECTWETMKSTRHKNQYALITRTEHNVDFLGTNASEIQHGSSCKYLIGMYNPQQGTLTTAPLQGNSIIRMEPRARSLDYSTISPAKPNDTSIKDLQQRRELNARLVEEFGSQRRKRQLATATAGQVQADHVSGGDAVMGIIASAGKSVASKDDIIKISLSNRNIPPHHVDAKSADDAYRYSEIVPSSVSHALEIKKLFPAENKPEYRQELHKSRVFGDGYVLSRLSVLITTEQHLRESRAQCLVFLGHLLKLYTSKSGTVIRFKENEGMSDVADRWKMASSVLEGILELFYSEESGQDSGRRYILSKEKKGLMLSWLLILALRAEPSSVMEAVPLQSLADELKMKGSEVAMYYRELGCVTTRSSWSTDEGGSKSGYKVVLMPPSAEEKVLDDYFPKLKLGRGKK